MRSKIPLLLILIAFLILGVIVFWGTLHRITQVAGNLPRVLENELQVSLNRAVTIRGARISRSGTAVIEDIAVANGTSFSTGTLFTARMIVIRFDLISILTGRQSTLRSISTARLYNPALRLVREPSGRWNVQDLFERPPSPIARRFQGILYVQDGTAVVVDYAAKLPRLPAENGVRSIDGSVDFANPIYAVGTLAGTGVPSRIRALSVSGRLGVRANATNLSIDIIGANSEYWLDYMTNIRTWTLHGGVFNARAALSQTLAGDFTARGSAAATGSYVTSPHLASPVRSVSANLRFINTNVGIGAVGTLGRSTFTARGHLPGLRTLNLRVESRDLDPASLIAAVRALPRVPRITWPAPGTLSALLTGPTTSPIVSASVTIPRAIINGVRTASIVASGGYRNGTMRIDTLRASVAGGSTRLSGTIGIRTGTAAFTGTATDFPLQSIAAMAGRSASGTVDARFSLTWARGLRDARLTANVDRGVLPGLAFATGTVQAALTSSSSGSARIRLDRVTAAGISMQSLVTDLGLRGRTIDVHRAVANTRTGTASARGAVTLAGNLDLTVSADDVDLLILLRPIGYTDVSGVADFTGTVTGTIGFPRLQGTAVARSGHIRQIRYDYLSGRLVATPSALALSGIILRTGRSEIATIGSITFARGQAPRVALVLRTDRARVSDLLRVLGLRLDITGIATADLRVSGAYPSLQASGTVFIREGFVSGFPLDTAQLSLQSIGGRTVITRLIATSGPANLAGSGYVTARGGLAVQLIGQDLPLTIANRYLYPYVVLDGTAAFSMNIGGTLARPTFGATLASDEFTVNQAPFNNMTATATWDGINLAISDARLASSRSTYLISSASLNRRTGSANLHAQILSSSITDVLYLARNSPVLGTERGQGLFRFLRSLPRPFDGVLVGNVELSVTRGNLTGTVQLATSDVSMGATEITRGELALAFLGRQIDVTRATVLAPGIDLATTARLIGGQSTQVAVNIQESEISAILQFLDNASFLDLLPTGRDLRVFAAGVPRPVTGTLTAQASVTDLPSAPTGTATLTTSGLTIAGEQVGVVSANSRLVQGTLVLDSLTLTGTDYLATFQGSISPGGLIDISGSGTNMPLALLRPWARLRDLTGTANFTLTASGTTGTPLVSMSLTATNVSSSLFRFDTLQADRILLAGGRLSTDQLAGAVDGSRVVVSGSVPFVWRAPFIPPDLPVRVHAEFPDQDLSILEALTGVVLNATGTVSAVVDLTGTLGQPQLSGSISIANGIVQPARFRNAFTDIRLVATFREAGLAINEFTGASSLGGSFAISGNVEFPNLASAVLNTAMTLNDLALQGTNVTGVYNETFRMAVTGQLTVTERVRSPLIRGQLVVRDARISVPTSTLPTVVPPSRRPVNPRFEVTLNLARNVEVQRGPLVAQITGPVSVGGTLTRPNVVGTVAITQGRLSYVGRAFRFQPGGTASFVFNPPSQARIDVDVTAQTTVLAVSPTTNIFTRYTITLDIAGPVGNLDIDVSSSPPGLSQEDVIGLLFHQAEIEALLSGQPFTPVLQQQLAEILLGSAFPTIFQGFEVGPFAVTLQPGIDVPLYLSVSYPLTSRVLLSYSTAGVGETGLSVFTISYAISPRFSVAVQLQSNNQALYLIQASTRF